MAALFDVRLHNRKGSETTAMTIDKYFRLKTVGFRQINKEYQYLTSYDMVIYG